MNDLFKIETSSLDLQLKQVYETMVIVHIIDDL